MIDEPGTELSLPGFMYDEDVKMVKKGIKILGIGYFCSPVSSAELS